jgi:hypothetical protein
VRVRHEQLVDTVRKAADKVTGKFFCVNCGIDRPVDQKRRRGCRLMCSVCFTGKPGKGRQA